MNENERREKEKRSEETRGNERRMETAGDGCLCTAHDDGNDGKETFFSLTLFSLFCEIFSTKKIERKNAKQQQPLRLISFLNSFLASRCTSRAGLR
jgi:hypothetical protein